MSEVFITATLSRQHFDERWGFLFMYFGLVEYPAKADISLPRKDLGPKWTIAPEMKRNPHTADGKLADVYSMAKTMWILLTKEEKGFEGQYSSGSSIEIKKLVPSIYQGPIDNLLHNCTGPRSEKPAHYERICGPAD